MKKTGILFIIIFSILTFNSLYCQIAPGKPISYLVSNPLVVNPAFAGSEDIAYLNAMTNINSSKNTQLIVFDSRIKNRKNSKPYSDVSSFKNIGLGTYLFHEETLASRNLGLALAASYHVPLGKNGISGLSFGLSLKGIYSMGIPNTEGIAIPDAVFPGADLGILYYSSRGFVGISSVNLQNLFMETGNVTIPLKNEQLIYTGYKFILNREKAFIIEPSIVFRYNNSSFTSPLDNLIPTLRIYIENASFGAIYDQKPILFMQYQFPRIFTGVLVELPGNDMLLDRDELSLELSFGYKLNSNQSGHIPYHW